LGINFHPEKEQYADAVWLYRAAAYLDDADKINKQQKKRLFQYFNTADNSQYHFLGKMLLGIIEEKEVISKTMDSKQVCEATFFLGIKAQSNDDYASAAKWFRASISTNLSKNGEYRWSYDRLYDWRNKSRSLKIISKQTSGDT
jgi:lipoprotein NlpI